MNKNLYETSTIIEKDNIKIIDSKSSEKKSSTLQVRVNTEIFGPSPQGGYRPSPRDELGGATPPFEANASPSGDTRRVNFGKPVIYKIGEINHYRKLVAGASKESKGKRGDSPEVEQKMPAIQMI